jgi:endonuclease/exonuclease/phosphatase family metal-dependent hydrolase
VVCLQEVWTDDDADEFQDALRDLYPYSFREKTEDTAGKSVECGIWNTWQLDRCVKNNCAPVGISAEECVLTKCADRYNKLSDSCKLCLAANTDSPTWCAIWPGAPQYTSDGRNGLLLLSKHPIGAPSYTPFDTALVKRGMITAEIQNTTVHCTHLSSDLKVVPYPEGRALASWIEEQKEQVITIQKATLQGQCTVLLGDLNTGPDTPTLTGEVPEIFNLISLIGFEEPWPNAPCTWCSDNPLAGSDTERQLDHIMVQSCPDMELHYQRVLDRPTFIDHDDKTLLSRLSDHYGLRLDLVPVAPASK